MSGERRVSDTQRLFPGRAPVRDDFLAENTPPMTIPQRLTAIETRLLSIDGTLGKLVPEVKRLRNWARWSKIGLKVAPVVATAAAAQFPQFKGFILGLINAIQVTQ